jgi:hypothetical protein
MEPFTLIEAIGAILLVNLFAIVIVFPVISNISAWWQSKYAPRQWEKKGKHWNIKNKYLKQ